MAIVIVTCPSCQTRYRHPLEEPDPYLECRCSRCESVFLPGPVLRRYMILDSARVDSDDVALAHSAGGSAGTGDDARPALPLAATSAPTMTIGMDDPSLADRLGETAVSKSTGHDRPAMTYSVVAGETGRAGVTVQPPGDSPARLPEIWLSLDGDDHRIRLAPPIAGSEGEVTAAQAGPDPAIPPTAEVPDPDDVSVVEDDLGEDPELETDRGRSGMIAWFAAVLMIASFSALGWFIVPDLGTNRWTSDPQVTGPASGAVGLLICWLWLRWTSRKH